MIFIRQQMLKSDLLPHSFEVEAFEIHFKCIDLPTLIRIKEAAARPKDREALAELRALLEESAKKASLGERRFSRRDESTHQGVRPFLQEHSPRA
jgi:predicted nucleotidyltransferase